MCKVLVFGGAFDPIHKGHLTVANKAQIELGFDEVWFTPCTSSRYDKGMERWVDRIHMVEYAIQDYPAFKVCMEEGDCDARGRMYVLAIHLKKKYPEHEFQFLIGSDTLDKINTWYMSKELTEEFDFVTFPRTGESSTDVRKDIKNDGRSDLIIPKVQEYIKERNLYDRT